MSALTVLRFSGSGKDMETELSNIHFRRSVRLPMYDYASVGMYFITICANERQHLFGEIKNGEMHPGRGEPCVRPSVEERGPCPIDPKGEHKVRPYRERPNGTTPHSIGRVVQAFKSISTVECIHLQQKAGFKLDNHKLWQRNYYERVIRSERELEQVREYILNNPAKWESDPENIY